MARCRRCGKSGLFFKVNSEGYCEICAQQLRDEEIERHNKEHKRMMAMAAAKGQTVPQAPQPVYPEYTLECISGVLVRCYKSRLSFKGGNVEENIPFSAIQSFTIVEPSGHGNGKIIIKTSQAPSGMINLGFGIAGAVGSERTFYFAAKELPTAQKIRDYIDNAGNQPPVQTSVAPPVVQAAVSAADEIRKYKSLMDDGIITQEEFDAKKKQLLGL